MKMETFAGTHREIGRQQGARYRERGRCFKPTSGTEAFARQLRIYMEFYPAFVEQCEGIAEGGGFDRQAVMSELLVRTEEGEKGCTIFGVQNGKGAFVGRNYDWHPSAEKVCETCRIETNTSRYVAVTDMYLSRAGDMNELLYDPEDVINDEGLYIGLTFAYDDTRNDGILPPHMLQLIGETCSTVDDALAVFEKVPLTEPKNFFIADCTGEMAVVEHTSKRFRILQPEDGVLIQTNNFVDKDLAEEDNVLRKRPGSDTYIRYYEALQQINIHKDVFDLQRTEKLLEDRHLHLLEKGEDVRTIWSLALEMTKREYWLYYDLLRKRHRLKI